MQRSTRRFTKATTALLALLIASTTSELTAQAGPIVANMAGCILPATYGWTQSYCLRTTWTFTAIQYPNPGPGQRPVFGYRVFYPDPVPLPLRAWNFGLYPDITIHTTDGRTISAVNDGDLYGLLDFQVASITGKYWVDNFPSGNVMTFAPFQFDTVPEPGSLLLLSLGAGVLLLARVRRGRR